MQLFSDFKATGTFHSNFVLQVGHVMILPNFLTKISCEISRSITPPTIRMSLIGLSSRGNMAPMIIRNAAIITRYRNFRFLISSYPFL